MRVPGQGMDAASGTSTLTSAAPPEGWQSVAGYDWRAIAVPELGKWQPTRSISVVLPAFNRQAELDRALAALAQQRYPGSLMEVIVVDDGSQPPLMLSEYVPDNTRLMRLERDVEWGRGRTRHAGALAADGEILLFLDADMVAHPQHLEAHARWHHAVRDAVTLGHKLFVDFDGITPAQVHDAAANGELSDLVADRPQQEHDWVERLIERTDELTKYHSKMFLAAVGATVGMRADLYRETGGFRTHLDGGEDMELGYRLMTAGAVFIPERQARSWHQGPATYMTRADETRRQNQPHFSNYVPVPGGFRPWTPGRQYAVPMVNVMVEVGESYEETKTCVDALLAGLETDLRVDIWGTAPDDCLNMLHADYHADPRVQLRIDEPETGYPSRFTLSLPAWVGLSTDSMVTMVGMLERSGCGALRVVLPSATGPRTDVFLWRTAALLRAQRISSDRAEAEAIAVRLFGEQSATAPQVGLVDLRQASLPALPRAQLPAHVALERLARAQAELQGLRRRHRRLRTRYGTLAATLGQNPLLSPTERGRSLPALRKLLVKLGPAASQLLRRVQ